MIHITNLHISYQRNLLNDVEFIADRGFVTLIRGESGSGKTSLLYRIALLSSQNNFDYLFNDIHLRFVSQKDKANIRKYHMAYVLQDSSLIHFYTVSENIRYYASMVGKEINDDDIQKVLDEVNLELSFDRNIKTLSGGERQRLAIACALIKDCEIIILDEPTSSLDVDNENRIFNLIQKLAYQKNKCIVVASHSMQAINYSDSVYQIENQQLIHTKIATQIEQDPFQVKPHKTHIKFLYDYVKVYFQKFLKKQLNNIFITILSFLLIAGTFIGIQFYQNKSSESLLKISDNQVYISSQENGQYIHMGNQIFSDFDMNQFLNKEYDIEVYPYIYSQMEILGQKIDILPYYPENNFKNKIEYHYNISQKGLILGYETYQLLKRNNISSQFINHMMTIRIDDKKTIHFVEKMINMDVQGVLKNGELNHYSENQYFIYISFDILQNLYSQETNNNEFIGYTLFSRSFDEHMRVINHLEKENLSINDTFQNSLQLEEIIKNSELMKFLFIVSVFVATLFIISLMSLNQFHLRKKEFALSVIAGLTVKDIVGICMIESLFQNMISLIVCLCMMISLLLPFVGLTELMNIIFIMLVEVICIFIVIYMLNFIQLNKLSIEDVLR